MDKFGRGYCAFVDSSPTPFHVCKTASAYLEHAGFKKIREDESWRKVVSPGGKYYFSRNGTTLVAFIVGPKYKTGNGFKIVGAHADSCVLRVKPVSKRSGYAVEQVGVEPYGGGLWHSWFDRDLGVAGRVIVKHGNGVEQRLIHITDPILRIPNLCIHLQTAEERAAFAYNQETHLLPILANLTEDLNAVDDDNMDKRHSPTFLKLLARELKVKPEEIMDFELSLCDTQPCAVGGANKEFIFAPRCDDQAHCYTATRAICELAKMDDKGEEGINMVCLFDHEEVGSNSNEGAGSPIIRDAIERLTTVLYTKEKEIQADLPEELIRIGLAKSFLWSADVTHAVHPNYPDKHESNHQPKLGQGTVISTNQGQKFSTNSVTGFVLRELCRTQKVGYRNKDGSTQIPCQEYVNKNGTSGGSTIGPILAHGVGIRTVDAGISQLSMHSIREQVAVADLWSNFHLIQAFFKQAQQVEESIKVGDIV